MRKNQVGFNNFKAFGPKMQYFTKKPITLIYGPNSMGKSSFLHSQLYLQNIKNLKISNRDIFKSLFAGDELDFGGFENYAHKHDINSTIQFETIYTKKEDILEFFFSNNNLPIQEIINSNVLNNEINSEMINQKLESFYQNTNIKFQYILDLIDLDEKAILAILYSQEDEIKIEKKLQATKEQELEIINSAMEDYFNKSISNTTEEEKKEFTNKIHKTIKQIKKEATELEKIIFLTLHTKTKDIVSRLNFFQYLLKIKKITILIDISYIKNTKIIPKISIFIDDKVLMEVKRENEKYKNPYLNEDNVCIKEFNKVTSKYILFRKKFSNNFFNIYNDINFSLANFLINISKKDKIQYFGPLRPYPQRWDMSFIEKKENNLERIELNDLNIVIKKIFLLAAYISQKGKNSTLENFTNYFVNLLLIPLYVNKRYRKFVFDEEGIDEFNEILPKNFQIWNKNKYQANNAWKALIYDQDILPKLNKWLQNKEKLKSSYEVKINRTAFTYLEVFWFSLNKLFNTEETYFKNNNIRFKKRNISKIDKIFVKPFIFINTILNTIERRLNIKQRYKSQIIFKDLSYNIETTPRDMGLGISQILPILISIFSSKKTKIYLEQPELHLHPAVQMEIADEFIRSAKENKNEFMIETHSEHLLLRIMKRMRHTAENKQNRDKTLDLTPDDVCLLYIDNDGDSTYIQELRLSSSGKLLDAWPNGFFEEGFKERFS